MALAITVLGLASLLFGIATILQGTGSFGIYFALFGLAAIFMFSGVSVLPTARNNKKAIMERADKAQQDMAGYLKGYGGAFPLPARYAHPIVLKRMQRVIEWWRSRPCSSTRTTGKQADKNSAPSLWVAEGRGALLQREEIRARSRRWMRNRRPPS